MSAPARPNDARPVTQEEFAPLMAAFDPFEARPVLAVGVSGGRDSLALAMLAHDWAAARQGRIVALIVDHGLRPEAASEAAATAAVVSRHGLAAEVLRWSGAKPSSGLQEAAREARYRLMFEACRARGILHLLVAHQADDQAETVAMRAARESGPDGLAGMAALVEHRHGRLLRPLLAVPRARLTATLEARGVRWIDDPSNSDPRFERARLRQGADLPPAGASAAAERTRREERLAELAVATLEWDDDGAAALDRLAFARIGRDQAARLLGRVVQSVGQRDYPPRRDRLERAVIRLIEGQSRGKSGKSQDFTLSECRLMLRQAPASRRLRWIVRPENGRKGRQKSAQPLIPAVFFACGVSRTPHLDE
ncbi:MAG: tRNA lysidine(34) synthetase TilS [Alphaproteobacteria bacterium]|nr:tRNA lysidine(34) synthetase TilS [Alphaproteobacteria bacterium]